MRAPAAKRARPAGRAVSVPLRAHAMLEARPDGHIFVRHEGQSLDLGWFSAGAAKRALALGKGVGLAALGSRSAADREFESLMQRLRGYGLLEYPVAHGRGADA